MRRLFLVGALLAAMLIPTASATAAPTGEYAVFSQCPTQVEKLFLCIYNKQTGGSVTTGKKTVPIKNPVILQGGVEISETTGKAVFYGAKNGVTLSKAKQPVPGGLLGITAPTWWPNFIEDWFNDLISEGFTGVDSTVELAGPASSIHVDLSALFNETGVNLSLPVKIKLDNAILGSNCYIGSNSNPIIWNLTVGETSPPPPNKPIKGFIGEGTSNPEETILRFKGQKQVDNSFAVPATSGCGGIFSFLVDPLVSSVVGVPSPAGTNTAILEGSLETGFAPAVRASDP
jgi:hypothetical protein